MADYTVKSGDCFSSIAARNGFYKYSTLYQHADNTATRVLRANPNMLVPGDVVSIPAKRAKKVAALLDGTTKLLIDRCPTHLVAYVGRLDKATYTLTSCQLQGGGRNMAALPDGNGKVEIKDIDASATSGSLQIEIPALPAAPPPAAAALLVTPPPHPPVVVPEDFNDPAPDFDVDVVRVRWTLKLGQLEPHDTVRGVLQRLVNLGYDTPVVEVEYDKTRSFVKHYQAFGGTAAPSGNVADVRASVEALHDHP
jgi:hypothetical protein